MAAVTCDTGAELEGIVTNAVSFALDRAMNEATAEQLQGNELDSEHIQVECLYFTTKWVGARSVVKCMKIDSK